MINGSYERCNLYTKNGYLFDNSYDPDDMTFSEFLQTFRNERVVYEDGKWKSKNSNEYINALARKKIDLINVDKITKVVNAEERN